jgi:hypothetical protein
MRDYEGTRWRGASGDVATVEHQDHRGLVWGKWDSGILWHEHADMLPKLYVEVDGGPIGVTPTPEKEDS